MDGRKNNGKHRKLPAKQKKKGITIYQITGEIEELGGMTAVRNILHGAFSEALINKRNKAATKYWM